MTLPLVWLPFGPSELGDPPLLARISVTPPVNGVVTVVGEPGAVFSNAFLAIRNLYTGATVYTRASSNGAFDAEIAAVANTPFWVSPSATEISLARQQQRGRPQADDLREVSAAEARELFPALGEVLGALYLRTAARVDGRLMGRALRRAAENRGLTVLEESVTGLVRNGSRVTGVHTQAGRIDGGATIIAGGAWSAALGEQLGVHIAVEPQRGQIIHLHLAGADTGNWAVVTAFHGHYLVCWDEGRVVAGATRETGAGFAPQTSVAGVHEVLSEAMRVAPSLSEAAISEIRVGLRPRTEDNLPVLGSVPGVEGVYLATGHGATGLHLGPLSGKLAAEWAMGKESDVDISAFHVSRWKV